MQSGDNDTKETNSTTNVPEQKEFEPLYSEDEVRNIVKAFISAWMRKDVQIKFPLAEEIKNQGRFANRKIDNESAMSREVSIKTELTDLISICAGHTGATPAQQKNAVLLLFQQILSYRSGNRIEGKFMEYIMEDRLAKAEDNIDELNKHFEELYFYVRTKLDNPNPLGGK